MPPILRNVLAVIGGAVVAVVLVSVTDAVVDRLWPLPLDLEVTDRAALGRAIAQMPVPALLALLAGWSLAAAAGAYLASRVSAGRPLWPGIVVTGLLLAATLANLAMIPHPVWMWPAALILIPAAGWAAARAAARPSPAPARVASGDIETSVG